MEPHDGLWGTAEDGTNWNGIVGTLQRQEADFAFGITPLSDRFQVMSYSIPYYQDQLLLLSKKPSPLSQHLALSRPFTGEVTHSLQEKSTLLFFSIAVFNAGELSPAPEKALFISYTRLFIYSYFYNVNLIYYVDLLERKYSH